MWHAITFKNLIYYRHPLQTQNNYQHQKLFCPTPLIKLTKHHHLYITVGNFHIVLPWCSSTPLSPHCVLILCNTPSIEILNNCGDNTQPQHSSIYWKPLTHTTILLSHMHRFHNKIWMVNAAYNILQAFLQINSVWSLPANSLRMDAPCLITTFRKASIFFFLQLTFVLNSSYSKGWIGCIQLTYTHPYFQIN